MIEPNSLSDLRPMCDQVFLANIEPTPHFSIFCRSSAADFLLTLMVEPKPEPEDKE